MRELLRLAVHHRPLSRAPASMHSRNSAKPQSCAQTVYVCCTPPPPPAQALTACRQQSRLVSHCRRAFARAYRCAHLWKTFRPWQTKQQHCRCMCRTLTPCTRCSARHRTGCARPTTSHHRCGLWLLQFPGDCMELAWYLLCIASVVASSSSRPYLMPNELQRGKGAAGCTCPKAP